MEHKKQKRNAVGDEPIDIQREETLSLTWGSMPLKEGCEKLPTGKGKFGGQSNPIPVNGVIGIYAYLNRLCTKDGSEFEYFRTGSLDSYATVTRIDEYVIKSIDRKTIMTLHFDMYNLWRSTTAPYGLRLKPYNELSGFALDFLKSDIRRIEAEDI